MRVFLNNLNCAVTALIAALLLSGPSSAQDADLDPLFEALKGAEGGSYQEIEEKIWQEWSKSGSPAMDLLLERGRMAMEAGDHRRAIEHFSALIDHAPEFAEAYNMRATAYFHEGLYGPSVEDIRQTLSLNPRHFGAMSGLALILQEIGRPEGALEALRAVEAIHPHREGLRDQIERLEREVEGATL